MYGTLNSRAVASKIAANWSCGRVTCQLFHKLKNTTIDTGWVGRGNFTLGPSENRTWTSQLIRLLSFKPHGNTPFGFCYVQGLLLLNSWSFVGSWMTEPLCSAAITAASTLLRARPPLCNASILSASQFYFCLCLSLNIVATGSRSSTSEPRSSSRHLYAGRRLAS